MGTVDQAEGQGHPWKQLCAGEIRPGSGSMSRSTKDYEIGRGRPPKATQWKKGQSANPGGLSSRSVDVAETIDKLLLTPVKVTVNGVSKRVAVLKVILEQLWNKGVEGDRRAMA